MTDYVAGIAGGIAVVLVGHPFDTCKTRMQVAPEGYYKNTYDCVRKTYKSKGIKGFYAGICSPLLGQMFFRSAAFGTFFYSVKYLSSGNSDSQQATSTQLLQAGAITGFVVSFIEAPIDLIKTKLQVDMFTKQNNSISAGGIHATKTPKMTVMRCIAHVIKCNGPLALWQGWSATAVRNIPANALFFPVNELVKRGLAKRHGVMVDELHTRDRLVAGACAGLSYWVLTYPLDLIKGTMMAVAYESRTDLFSTARGIYNTHGARGFFRGLSPCAVRSVPACAAMFTTVDYSRIYLSKLMNSHNAYAASSSSSSEQNQLNHKNYMHAHNHQSSLLPVSSTEGGGSDKGIINAGMT